MLYLFFHNYLFLIGFAKQQQSPCVQFGSHTQMVNIEIFRYQSLCTSERTWLFTTSLQHVDWGSISSTRKRGLIFHPVSYSKSLFFVVLLINICYSVSKLHFINFISLLTDWRSKRRSTNRRASPVQADCTCLSCHEAFLIRDGRT